MANDNVTTEDLKATAEATAENLKESAADTFETVATATAEHVDKLKHINLSLNQKLVAVTVAAALTSAGLQELVKYLRPERVKVENVTVIVEADDVVEGGSVAL